VDDALARLPVAPLVAESDLDPVHDGLLQGGEMGRGSDRRAVPVRGVDDHRTSRRLGTGPEGLGEGPHELAEGRFHLGCGRAGARHQEQGAGLGGGEPAEVGARSPHQRPTTSPSRLRVHGHARHGQGFEVTTGGPGGDLELLRDLGHCGPPAGLQEQEGGHEAIGTHGPSIAPNMVIS